MNVRKMNLFPNCSLNLPNIIFVKTAAITMIDNSHKQKWQIPVIADAENKSTQVLHNMISPFNKIALFVILHLRVFPKVS